MDIPQLRFSGLFLGCLLCAFNACSTGVSIPGQLDGGGTGGTVRGDGGNLTPDAGAPDDGAGGGPNAGGNGGHGGNGGNGGEPNGAPGCKEASAKQTLNVAYASVAGVDPNLLSLDIYEAPLSSECGPAPVVIWVHGGGFKTGDKAGGNIEAKVALFRQMGYVTVSINYRLSPSEPGDPNIKHPVHMQDVARAVAWIHDNIGGYGGDHARMAILGHSAGAHLTALVSTDGSYLGAHGRGLANIRCTGSFDSEGYDITHAVAESENLALMYRNAFGDDTAVWAAASPINHVAAGKDIGPILLVARGSMNRLEMVEAFRAKLAAAGVPATVIDAKAYSHLQVNQAIGEPHDTIMTPAIRTFLTQCLGANPLPPFEGTPPPAKGSDFAQLARIRFSKDWLPAKRDPDGKYMGGTEVTNFATLNGRLYAGIGVWRDNAGSDPATGAQIIRKDGPDAPWWVEHDFGVGYVRVDEMATLRFTTDGMGRALPIPLNVLVACPSEAIEPREATVFVRSPAGQWQRTAITADVNETPCVRAIAQHRDNVTGVDMVFAGVANGSLYSGRLDTATPGGLAWANSPELKGTGRIHAIAEANGILFASIGGLEDDPSRGGLFARGMASQPKRWVSSGIVRPSPTAVSFKAVRTSPRCQPPTPT